MISRFLERVRRLVEIAIGTAASARPIRRGPPANLDKPVIISLTSFPPRFATLNRTLRSLLNQSVTPQAVVLWIAEGDFSALPANVLALQRHGLTIRTCEDLRSLKKILPALKAFPEAYIATADDDMYYWRDWLRGLTSFGSGDTITANTVRIPKMDGDKLASLFDWDLNYDGEDAGTPSNRFLFPTGAGVLFPPKSLHPDVHDFALFNALCPTCDDTWVGWMAHRAGSRVRRVPGPKQLPLIGWERSGQGSLFTQNLMRDADGFVQDKVIQNVANHFGIPQGFSGQT